MRKLSFFILCLFFSITCFTQEIDPLTLEPSDVKYYPVNKFIKSHRIKCIIDSSRFISPGECRTFIYDTLGRLIGDINYPLEKFDNPYVYRKIGDTTYRLCYYKDTLMSYKRFVHNKKGQIVSYLDCANYYFKNDSYYVRYEAFYYDDNNMLRSKLSYYSENFPGKVAGNANIKPTDLELLEVINYTYKTLNNGNKLIIGKHALGKPDRRAIDSSIYDKQNRIIRYNSFVKKGGGGCRAFDDLNYITVYKYSDSTLKITSYSTYCNLIDDHIGCLSRGESDMDVESIIYNPDKAPKVKFGFYQSGEQYMKNKYVYTYY